MMSTRAHSALTSWISINCVKLFFAKNLDENNKSKESRISEFNANGVK